VATKTKPAPKKKAARPAIVRQQSRFWLMYPPKQITRAIIWEVGHKFPVVTNIRQASVTDEIGIVCVELEGLRNDIKAAVKWLENLGISVEPVEINVIES
jgi:hypothetical protein